MGISTCTHPAVDNKFPHIDRENFHMHLSGTDNSPQKNPAQHIRLFNCVLSMKYF